MQNQYFGDIGDFGKYVLLRRIQRKSRLKLGINWYFNEDDKKDESKQAQDGKYIQYLKNDYPRRDDFRALDTKLYDILHDILCNQKIRDIGKVKKRRILKNFSEWKEVLPRDRKERANWFQESLRTFQKEECDIIFADPDNQIEVQSKPYSTKHIRYCEAAAYWQAGFSLILYNHRDRSQRRAYLKKLYDIGSNMKLAGIKESLCPVIWEYSYGTQRHYVFLIQEEHKQELSFLFSEECKPFQDCAEEYKAIQD